MKLSRIIVQRQFLQHNRLTRFTIHLCEVFLQIRVVREIFLDSFIFRG